MVSYDPNFLSYVVIVIAAYFFGCAFLPWLWTIGMAKSITLEALDVLNMAAPSVSRLTSARRKKAPS